MDKEALKAIGLFDAEIEIYLALFGEPRSTASTLAIKTGMHRPYVYDVLTKLIRKGLVSYSIMSGKKHFQAANPARILEILREKEENVKRILPELSALYKQPKSTYTVQVLEGVEGLKTYYAQILKDLKEGKVKEVVTFGGGSGREREFLKYYWPGLILRGVEARMSAKVKFRGIWDSKVDRSWNLLSFGKHKFFPPQYSSRGSFDVYNDKVGIKTAQEKPLVIAIQSKYLAESFRNVFNCLWGVL